MSFIPENTPFIALPTALKGKVTPFQLSVIWVLQSYYPNIWPSYQTISKDAKMSRDKVIKTVAPIVELGFCKKQYRIDENIRRQTVIGSQFGINARHFLYQIPVFMRGH